MYYIYENWTAEKKAVIHKSNCSYCNDGEGTKQGNATNLNGKWHGGFDNYEEALRVANSLENREVRKCGFCMK